MGCDRFSRLKERPGSLFNLSGWTWYSITIADQHSARGAIQEASKGSHEAEARMLDTAQDEKTLLEKCLQTGFEKVVRGADKANSGADLDDGRDKSEGDQSGTWGAPALYAR
jgi:hypothetical protein